ncbi:hypothetical protein [Streptomyces sp. H39-C1]|uniref:hypothetical protein n=1 Tax=Streptomyces sp. H39-C1 TaxID=3004355 RepID=UPI0022AEF470|nr:hypothetical protein [Streptomyces sp. H39-C1]MCZ4101810.1 hypothetical protein [Streptomyces sp. H39-C1]
MDPAAHFVFGTHDEHGFVASFTPSVTPHLAEWFLVREQFEPVPHQPRLFRLSEPERDGPRRTRQAVQDLRRLGYAVHADLSLDPATSVSSPRPALPDGLLERRSRLAQAAASRSPQRSPAPTTAPPSARPIPPKPTYAPTIHWAVPGTGRPR